MLKKDADALADFGKAIELSPRNPQYYLERGLFYYNTGDLQNALTDLSKTVENGGENALVYYTIGIIKIHMGEYAEAETAFTKCLSLNPDEKLKAEAEQKRDEAKKALEKESATP
jgi:tetratricopeptide (TPR) repeat protein